MTVFRRPLQKTSRTSPSFSQGRTAIAIDQRTGFKHKQSEMMFEPGTNYFVHRKESDGKYSLVNHPQNYISDKLKRPDRVGLQYPSLDTPLFVGTIISADQLGLPSHASVIYASNVWTSLGTGTSVSTGTGVSLALNFSSVNNSMYYVIIFQGI